jgi:FKBP-type peptidyl-prolyl cis-trans isomerase FklB
MKVEMGFFPRKKAFMQVRRHDPFRFTLLLTPAIAIASYAMAAPVPVAAARSTHKTAEEAAAYSLGLTFGGQLRHSGLDASVVSDALTQGIRDGLGGTAVTQQDKARVAELLRAAKDVVGVRNKAAAQEFLAKNAKVKGVTTLPSGLQYRVFSAGSADSASPELTDQVTVQYRGRLLNGTEFDSSYAHGKPISFRVNSVIKGWQEALSLMKPWAKWQLFVPPQLGYDVNTPAAIPPGSLLVFDIELVKIGPPADPGASAPPKAVPPRS